MKRISLILLILFFTTTASGCVRRIVTLDSQPPEAEVYLNHKFIGKTPLSYEFLYYGGHHLQMVKEGYSNLNTTLVLKGPVYEYFPLSVFSELLIPWEITDEHHFSFKLEKGETKKPVITPIEQPQPPLPPTKLERLKKEQ